MKSASFVNHYLILIRIFTKIKKILGVDLSNYALEDLLAFDDIFLDYFNNFLKLPVSPSLVSKHPNKSNT